MLSQTPLLLYHGSDDQVVTPLTNMHYLKLAEPYVGTDLLSYNLEHGLGHDFSQLEGVKVAEFIQACLAREFSA